MTTISVGLTELPQSNSAIRAKVMQTIAANEDNFFTSAVLFNYCKCKTRSYFSDLLWHLAVEKQVVKVQRGIYKFNKTNL